MNRTNRTAVFALSLLGGYFIWRNRFAIQRQLETYGVNTPFFKGDLEETAKSVASKTAGKMERGATLAENYVRSRAI